MVTEGSDSTFLVRVFMLKYLVRTGLVCRFLVSLPSWKVFVEDVKQNNDVTKPIYCRVYYTVYSIQYNTVPLLYSKMHYYSIQYSVLIIPIDTSRQGLYSVVVIALHCIVG